MGLALHPLHRQFTGIVEGLGEYLDFGVAPDIAEGFHHALMRHVIDAGAHHHFQRPIARLQQQPQILSGQVGGEGFAADALEHRVAGGMRDRGADRHEFQDILIPLHAFDFEAYTDHAIGMQGGGFLLHARHGEFAGVIHRLGQHGHFLVAVPGRVLHPNVIDARSHHQSERFEPGLAHHQEFIDRKIGGEHALVTAFGA